MIASCNQLHELLSVQAADVVSALNRLKQSFFRPWYCLNRWFFLVFPWHLGKEFQRIKPEDIAELDRLSKHWE